MLAILVAAAWVSCTQPWAPVSDLALIELQVAEVFGRTPLVGTYSRHGWNHPGPAMFWVLAIPYHLAGRHPAALLVGAALVNAGAVLGIARVARRRGGLALSLLALGAVVLLMRSVGLERLTSPWNPYLPLLAFVWFQFLVWDTACGHRRSMPLAAGIGSFVAQTYIGYALPVGMLLALGAGIAIARDGRKVRSALAATAVVVAALWLPVAIEQVAEPEGNLTQLWRFFVGGESTGAFDGRRGATLLARELVGFAPWLGAVEGAVVRPRHPIGLLVPMLALAAAGVSASRRGHADAAVGLIVASAAALSAGIALSAIAGHAFPYLVRWTWGVALFLHVMILWALSTGMSVSGPLRQRAAWAAVGLMLALSIATIIRGRHATLPGASNARVVLALGPPVLEWLRTTGARSVFVQREGWCGPPYAGLVAAIARRGLAVTVRPDDADFPGHVRTATRPFDARLVALCGARAVSSRPPGLAFLASYPSPGRTARRSPIPIAVFAAPTGPAGGPATAPSLPPDQKRSSSTSSVTRSSTPTVFRPAMCPAHSPGLKTSPPRRRSTTSRWS